MAVWGKILTKVQQGEKGKLGKKVAKASKTLLFVRWGKKIHRLVEMQNIPLKSTSDVDPDPVGSAFILVRGSGSRGIK